MKSIIFVTPVDINSIDKLSYFDHTVVYYDKESGLIKRAIPDYNGNFISDPNIEEAINSNRVACFKNVNYRHISKEDNLITLTIDDGVVVDMFSNIYSDMEFAGLLSNRGKKLVKRLK